jgi:hypothetical protein
MSIQNQSVSPQAPRDPSRRQRLLACTAVVLLAVSVFVTISLTRRGEGMSGSASVDPLQPVATTKTTTTTGDQTEVLGRLRQILRIREEAYRTRNTELLNTIYTSDCPCLMSDSNAIRELLGLRYVWVDIASSIEMRRAHKITEQLWNIVATFRSAPLRIETEDGRLVQEQPQENDFFQFTLAKPPGARQWLLARAVLYEGR